MTPTSKPILFFGTDDFSADFLRALIASHYDIRAVVTKPDSKKGRGQQLFSPLVKTIANEHGIPVWQPHKLTDIKADTSSLGGVAGVLVSYGKIIPASVIELFTPGIINVHPSLLPRYRGPSPVESAIANGDTTTGISIMQLSAAMDAGPVYSQVPIKLLGTETRSSLYSSLSLLGQTELLRVLPGILDGSLRPVAQDESLATYCQLLTKADGVLTPASMSARDAEQKIRAYLGFPKTRLEVHGEWRIITKAHVSSEKKTPLDVMFSDGKFLCIDELIAPSGKTIPADAFLRGYAA